MATFFCLPSKMSRCTPFFPLQYHIQSHLVRPSPTSCIAHPPQYSSSSWLSPPLHLPTLPVESALPATHHYSRPHLRSEADCRRDDCSLFFGVAGVPGNTFHFRAFCGDPTVAHYCSSIADPRVQRIFSPPPRDAWLRQPAEFRAHRRSTSFGASGTDHMQACRDPPHQLP